MKNPLNNLSNYLFDKKSKDALKITALCLSLVLFSCQTDVENLELEDSSTNNLSSKSEKLRILSYAASGAHNSYPSINAFDGNIGTRWTSNGVGEYLDIDLGENSEIDYVKLAHYKGTSRTYSFKIYTRSSSSSSWSQKGNKSSISSNSLQTYDITNSTGRYVRIECNGNTANNWSDLTEVEIWGTGNNSSTTITTDNLAQDKTTNQSSTSHGGISSKAVDGNTSGEWSNGSVTHTSNSYQPWWTVNLANNYSIGDVIIYNRTNCCTSRLSDFNVDVLNSNGSIVNTIYVESMSSSSIKVNFNGATGRSIKVRLNGTNPLSLAEVQVYEYNGNTTPPTTTPTTPTGGTVEDIIGDFWKVTMPVDKDGNASPRDCSEYDCRNNDSVDIYGLNEAAANSDYNDYFYEDNGWVIFSAFAGGATTENSQYPRCELRGLNGDGDDDYFDMDDYQELNVTVKVLSVPVERPEVNMVQIHGPDDEPLRIEYNDGTTGSDQGLHITYNEKNTWNDVMDYEIEDELKVRVVVEDGRISFWLENLTNGDTYNNDFNSSDDTGYFKVGCYLQSSISYCDVKSDEDFCKNGGQSDDYDATGSVAVKDLTMIRDGKVFK